MGVDLSWDFLNVWLIWSRTQFRRLTAAGDVGAGTLRGTEDRTESLLLNHEHNFTTFLCKRLIIAIENIME